jgi:hypothetical protein
MNVILLVFFLRGHWLARNGAKASVASRSVVQRQPMRCCRTLRASGPETSSGPNRSLDQQTAQHTGINSLNYMGGHLEAEKDPGHFFGKGYLKIVFDRIAVPNSEFPLDAKIVAARLPCGQARRHQRQGPRETRRHRMAFSAALAVESDHAASSRAASHA